MEATVASKEAFMGQHLRKKGKIERWRDFSVEENTAAVVWVKYSMRCPEGRGNKEYEKKVPGKAFVLFTAENDRLSQLLHSEKL